MAVNHFFQGGNGIGNTNEQRLHEDLIIESLKIFGHDVYYLPRTLVNRDLILGEDTLSKFDDSYLLEMYVETTEGLAGEQELINKFGLEIREETTFMLSKRRWSNAVDSVHTMIVEGRPNEGDIIYYPLLNKFFDIFLSSSISLPMSKIKVSSSFFKSSKFLFESSKFSFISTSVVPNVFSVFNNSSFSSKILFSLRDASNEILFSLSKSDSIVDNEFSSFTDNFLILFSFSSKFVISKFIF